MIELIEDLDKKREVMREIEAIEEILQADEELEFRLEASRAGKDTEKLLVPVSRRRACVDCTCLMDNNIPKSKMTRRLRRSQASRIAATFRS